jgi:osmotically-inducible protein OsmY
VKTDRQLQQDVIDELRWDVSVEAAHIGVEANEGVVTLSGRVGSYAEKFAAEDAAKRVAGVKAVAMDLEVKLPGSSLRTDSDIARAAVVALAWNVTVPKDAVQVKVDDGFVTLSGEVDWEFQRQAAVSAVRHLLGVRGVNNAVTLRVHVATKDVKSKIESALQRLAHRDTKAVSVEVLDGTVTLSGTTHSYLERDTIEAAAWNAAGVQRVIDRIVVSA